MQTPSRKTIAGIAGLIAILLLATAAFMPHNPSPAPTPQPNTTTTTTTTTKQKPTTQTVSGPPTAKTEENIFLNGNNNQYATVTNLQGSSIDTAHLVVRIENSSTSKINGYYRLSTFTNNSTFAPGDTVKLNASTLGTSKATFKHATVSLYWTPSTDSLKGKLILSNATIEWGK